MHELGVSETQLRPVLARLKNAGFVAKGKDQSDGANDYELLLCRARTGLRSKTFCDG